jgi:hypothetical protein
MQGRSVKGRSWIQPNLTSQIIFGVALFLAGVVSAHTWLEAPSANAQTKNAPQAPQAFLAGDERTEPIIREILVVIKKMDQRLESIEKAVTAGKKVGDGAESGSRSRSR